MDAWLATATQFFTLLGVIFGIYLSWRNGRVLVETKELVNGKTSKLEKLIEAKGFDRGVAAAEKENKT